MLQGRIGNQVFSIRNGKNYVRAVHKRNAPPTEAMKARQELFAKAGKLCKALKLQINESIKVMTGYNTMYTKMMSSLLRFTTAYSKETIQKGDASQFFYDCDFVAKKSLRNTFRVRLEFSNPGTGSIQLKIDAFTPLRYIFLPHNTSQVECKIIVAGAMAKDGTPTGSVTRSFEFDYNNKWVPEQVIDLQVPTPEGALLVIGMSLQYKSFSNNYHWSDGPSGIAHALYV